MPDQPARASFFSSLLDHGRAEWRYPSRDQLSMDARVVEQAGMIDPAEIARAIREPSPVPHLTGAERYLIAQGSSLLVGSKFDETFYALAYPDARTYAKRPLRHYADIGWKQRRVRTQAELDFRKTMIAGGFDPEFYRSQFAAGDAPSDGLAHYVLDGARLGLDPAPDFSVDFYLRRYPDLLGMQLDPFQHFVQYGSNEKRIAQPNPSSYIEPGLKVFDVKKPTLLIGLHDGSRTGAPLLGLLIAARLSENYNVAFYLGRQGELSAQLKSICFAIVPNGSPLLELEYILGHLQNEYGLRAVIFNSVESGLLAEASLAAGLPCLGLIHEFAEYTKPAGRMMLVAEKADRIIVPSELIEESLQNEVVRFRSGRLTNIIVRPQGHLPFLPPHETSSDLSSDEILAFINASGVETPKIILGAGHVQIRKGVDLFVQTAAAVRQLAGDDIRFLWIGSGYNPSEDLHYSLWVGDMIERLDLQGTVFFLPPQSNLDIAFKISDIFYLSSRLDPFPNVAIDAFASGKPVVCFKRATGIATYIANGEAEGFVADFCNVEQAARAIVDLFSASLGSRNKKVAETTFNFDNYIEVIINEIEIAERHKGKLIELSGQLETSELFDQDFYAGQVMLPVRQNRKRAVRDYVARSLNGVSGFNPRPGFNDGAYRSKHSSSESVGLLEALRKQRGSESIATHRCVVLDEVSSEIITDDPIAIHIHLHYSELALDFRRMFEATQINADLIITTTSANSAVEIRWAFRNYKLGEVFVIEGANRGRDIGPFVTLVGPILQKSKYKLVCHLHGKKSVTLGASLGERWRQYLIDTLVGDMNNLRAIWTVFAQEPNLGLVFAEDRNCVGWTSNRAAAETLAARANGSVSLPEFPIFPIGTMFWARTEALDVLWKLRITTDDLPVEPLPYDGTILHALERMLPALCEAAGYEWCTVRRAGLGW